MRGLPLAFTEMTPVLTKLDSLAGNAESVNRPRIQHPDSGRPSNFLLVNRSKASHRI